MKSITTIIMLYLILSTGSMPMNADGNENKVFPGIIAKSIEIACNAFEDKLEVKWENYVTKIEESEFIIIINFSSKDLPETRRGSAKEIPGFEIKIQKNDFKIIESQFIR